MVSWCPPKDQVVPLPNGLNMPEWLAYGACSLTDWDGPPSSCKLDFKTPVTPTNHHPSCSRVYPRINSCTTVGSLLVW